MDCKKCFFLSRPFPYLSRRTPLTHFLYYHFAGLVVGFLFQEHEKANRLAKRLAASQQRVLQSASEARANESVSRGVQASSSLARRVAITVA